MPRTTWVALSPQVDKTTHPLLASSLPEMRCPALTGQPLTPAPWSTPEGGARTQGSRPCPWGLLAALWRSELRPSL